MTEILEYADQVWRGEADTTAYRRGELQAEGLHEVHDRIWMWPGFGNVYVLQGEDGLVLFDSGAQAGAAKLHAAVRERFALPVRTVIYSHGHIDHVFGVGPFDAEADERGWSRPMVVAQENVPPRFDRYRATAGYNGVINQRQFGSAGFRWPEEYRYPDVTYGESMTLDDPDFQVALRHAMGETDDATIAWLPEQKVLLSGDFFIWASPNAGNPQKVQRYPWQWAQAMRWMADLGAELLLPGHGLPVAGKARIRDALLEAAELLESLYEQTVEAMNRGATLDETVQTVEFPEDLLSRPHLQPTYDEPEFVVRNVWRQLGGWYDGNPAHLKPAPDAELAREVAALAGGADRLAARAGELVAEEGGHRLAAHLVQLAADAAPDDLSVHRTRADVFAVLEKAARSTMSKGVYGWAKAQSTAKTNGTDVEEALRKANEHRQYRPL